MIEEGAMAKEKEDAAGLYVETKRPCVPLLIVQCFR